MGLMSAQRFPQDFDGIIAGAPALDYTGLVATQAAWYVQANKNADGSEVLDRTKVPLIATSVMAACDALNEAVHVLDFNFRMVRAIPAHF